MNRSQRRAGLAQAKARGSWEWSRVLLSEHDIEAHPIAENCVAAWTNDLYAVQAYWNETEIGTVEQLSVRSHHGRTIPCMLIRLTHPSESMGK